MEESSLLANTPGSTTRYSVPRLLYPQLELSDGQTVTRTRPVIPGTGRFGSGRTGRRCFRRSGGVWPVSADVQKAFI